jgi:hypothetical protein
MEPYQVVALIASILQAGDRANQITSSVRDDFYIEKARKLLEAAFSPD